MAKQLTDIDILAALERHGSQRKACKAIGMPRTTFQERVHAALKTAYTTKRMADSVQIEATGETQYFILSSAQDGSQVHEGFMENLEAFAEHLGATIYVAGYTYNKGLFEDHSKYRASYDPAVRDYLCNTRLEIGDGLLFCGEMNTLPTAVSPLTGFETYTQSKWGIFPHAKVQLVSVPTMKHEPAKMIMTTGTVTLPNYVQKRAGIRAEFHHVVGAVLVELDPEGRFFCRHLIAEEDGSFYDLTVRVEEGQITHGHNVQAVVWGDIHHEKLDPTVAAACFEKGGMLDWLCPEHQFLHDLSDFSPRNHHNIGDHHFRFAAMSSGNDNVESAITECGEFLSDIQRDWCQSVVVESNHDLALLKWLKTADYRNDPENAIFFLEAQARIYRAIAGNEDISIFKWALDRTGEEFYDTIFLREDDSYMLQDIEFGMHGHLGANGARPSPKQFTKAGPKACTGHTHSAGIIDGIYTAGVSSKLDLGYNKGLSSWSHTHIIVYQNGKRALVTMQDGLWCAK